MNNKPNIDVKGLRPFTKFLMTIGELPSSYLISMTYEEQLLWFCNYIQNTVIPAINNNASAVEELQKLFTELQTYVNNYFENLDVQEEINNKLDSMAEDGTLQTILLNYTTITRVYNTVEEMKNDISLRSGNNVRTTGYYEILDGGNAYYKIEEKKETVYQEELANGLYATLLYDTVLNIKQIGAYGDNENDDTDYFIKAFQYANEIHVPYTQNGYKIRYIDIIEHKKLKGIGNTRTVLHQTRGTESIISILRNGSSMDNIEIDSLDIDLEWNRFNIQSNTFITNCSFHGFRHVSSQPNAWGIYIDECENVIIRDCEFYNNSQSDIALTDNNNMIYIQNVSGNNLHIDFEPNTNNITKNVYIENSHIVKLDLLENTFDIHTLENINFTNCIIDSITYRGANCRFVNCRIQEILSDSAYGGVVENIGSWGYGNNLNDDPTFIDIHRNALQNSEEYWAQGYTPSSEVIQKIQNTTKGKYIQLNPNHSNTVISLNRIYKVNPNTLYAVRTLMNTITGNSVNFSGHALNITFYNDSTQINNVIYCCLDRNINTNTESDWTEKTVFIQTPTDCNRLKISICNTRQNTTSQTSSLFAYLFLNPVLFNTTQDNKDFRTYSNTYPNQSIAATGSLNISLVGETIYKKDLSDNVTKYICTSSGNTGTWKKTSELNSI